MAHSFTENFDGWYAYAQRFKDRPPRPLLTRAAPHATHRGNALDLGSGGLNDTRFLLDSGFDVTALDGEPVARSVADTLPPERFRYLISSFETFDFPVAAFDLVNAQYALPFVRPDHYDRVFAAVLATLRPGGIFTGQFFGDRDDWAGTPNMTFHTRSGARQLLAPLTLIEFTEEDDPASATLSGQPKH
ncbi:MAG: class I SAM-dependent methyltransferase, partial [Devosia sp.]